MPRHPSSLLTQLALAFLLAGLVPAALCLASYRSDSDRVAVRATEERLRGVVEERERKLAEHFDSLQRTAASLAESDLTRAFLMMQAAGTEVPGASKELVRTWTDELFAGRQGRSSGTNQHAFLADASGRVVLGPDHDGAGTHLGDTLAGVPCFTRALAGPQVSGVQEGEGGGRGHQLVLHPVADVHGEVLGLVGLEVAVDEVARRLAPASTAHHPERVTLAAERNAPAVDPGAPADGGLADFVADGARDVFRMQRASSVEPWTVTLEMDRADVLQPLARGRRAVLGYFGATVILVGAAAVLLAERFGRPLRRCARAAEDLARGRLDGSLPASAPNRELGTLQAALETLRARLRNGPGVSDEWSRARTSGLDDELEAARDSRERYELSMLGSQDGFWDWNLKTDRIYYAPRWKELLGLDDAELGDSPDEWIGRILPESLPEFDRRLQRHLSGESDRFDAEFEMRHARGGTRAIFCRGLALRDESGEPVRLAGSIADVSDLKHAQQELRLLANHDRLTGLPNRTLFTDRLRGAMARAKRDDDRQYAVLFFDFDRFKVINDSLGHHLGDALLVSIASRLGDCIREVDTVARFGGDEFVVLLDGIAGVDEAVEVCERLLDVFTRPHHLLGHEVVSTASIGLVTSHGGYADPHEVIRDADAAMYQAKGGGKGQYRLFDSSMHSDAVLRMNLELDLRGADFDREFRLHYQPIVDLVSGEIAGFEALVRWQHPRLGLIEPARFIPIAEETGLVVPLSEWILHTACAQLVEWRRDLGAAAPGFVNVNISRRHLVHPPLLPLLGSLVEEFELQPGDVKLEITETTVMDERHDMVAVMNDIQALGFQLAMDDFGTGHSSLSCLHQFPISVLKIDRSFICHMEENPAFTAVVQAIVTLAHNLELDVVAEGIESPEQLAQLQVMGCQYAQGYLFSKPVPVRDVEALLRSGVRRSRVA